MVGDRSWPVRALWYQDRRLSGACDRGERWSSIAHRSSQSICQWRQLVVVRSLMARPLRRPFVPCRAEALHAASDPDKSVQND